MTTNAQNTTSNNTLSEVDNSSISSLRSQVKQLEGRRDFWDAWYFWLIAGTALLIAATVSVQVVGRSINKKLSSAQAELIREKDRQLSIELKNKDLEIEAAKGIASGADERAGKAHEAAANAHKAAVERAVKLESDAEALRQANVVAEQHLETEKRKRVALAVSLLPRDFRDQAWAINALQPYRSMSAIIEHLPEEESTRMAEQIAFVLNTAKWNDISGGPMDSHVLWPEWGITIERAREQPTAPGPSGEGLQSFLDWEKREKLTQAAATSLLNSLIRSGIDARIGTTRFKPPPLTLSIVVGKKVNSAVYDALRELGQPQPSGPGITVGGNTTRIKPRDTDKR